MNAVLMPLDKDTKKCASCPVLSAPTFMREEGSKKYRVSSMYFPHTATVFTLPYTYASAYILPAENIILLQKGRTQPCIPNYYVINNFYMVDWGIKSSEVFTFPEMYLSQ